MRLASAPMEVVLLCDKHGNANVVKPDIGSAGPGCAAQATQVQIERWRAPTPEITAFDPPVLAAACTSWAGRCIRCVCHESDISERLEKRHQVGLVRLGKRDLRDACVPVGIEPPISGIQPVAHIASAGGIDVQYRLERGHVAVMHVRGREFYVAQAGCTKFAHVLHQLRDLVDAAPGLWIGTCRPTARCCETLARSARWRPC